MPYQNYTGKSLSEVRYSGKWSLVAPREQLRLSKLIGRGSANRREVSYAPYSITTAFGDGGEKPSRQGSAIKKGFGSHPCGPRD